MKHMYTRRNGTDGKELDRLFQRYRDACPAPEPGANFMPELWQRIESRQTISFFIGRMASGFVTAAVAITLAMAVYVYFPRPNPYYSESYVEALAASQVTESAEIFEPAHFEFGETAGQL